MSTGITGGCCRFTTAGLEKSMTQELFAFPDESLPGNRVNKVHWLDHTRYQIRWSTGTSLCHVSHTCLYYALKKAKVVTNSATIATSETQAVEDSSKQFNSTHDESHLNPTLQEISGKQVIYH